MAGLKTNLVKTKNIYIGPDGKPYTSAAQYAAEEGARRIREGQPSERPVVAPTMSETRAEQLRMLRSGDAPKVTPKSEPKADKGFIDFLLSGGGAFKNNPPPAALPVPLKDQSRINPSDKALPLLRDIASDLPPKGGTILGGGGVPMPRPRPPVAPVPRQRPSGGGGDGAGITVKAGDTLWDIAKAQYGDGNAYRAIAAANGITDPSKIKAGQKIILPGLTSAKAPAPASPSGGSALKQQAKVSASKRASSGGSSDQPTGYGSKGYSEAGKQLRSAFAYAM